MDTNPAPIQEPKPKQQLSDIGTRLEHLTDHCEGLEAVLEVLNARGIRGPADKERLVKISNAAEVMRLTLDTYLGVTDKSNEFKVYQLIKDIPKEKWDEIAVQRNESEKPVGQEKPCRGKSESFKS